MVSGDKKKVVQMQMKKSGFKNTFNWLGYEFSGKKVSAIVVCTPEQNIFPFELMASLKKHGAKTLVKTLELPETKVETLDKKLLEKMQLSQKDVKSIVRTRVSYEKIPNLPGTMNIVVCANSLLRLKGTKILKHFGIELKHGGFLVLSVNDMYQNGLSPEKMLKYGFVHEKFISETNSQNPEQSEIGWIVKKVSMDWPG